MTRAEQIMNFVETEYKKLALANPKGLTPEGCGYLVALGDVIRFVDKIPKEQEPQGLDEAELKYAESSYIPPANQEEEMMVYAAFKAGAKWMAGQGKTNPYSPVESAPGENSYATTGFALQFNDASTFKPYQSIKKTLALGFMKVLDEIRPKGKMCLSNGECMDIEKAFDQQDWERLERYLKKYSPATR